MVGVTLKSKFKEKWSGETLKAALENGDFRDGKLSLSKLAKIYDIPKSTLHRYLKQQSCTKERHGPKPVLSEDEETAIATWLKEMAKLGFGRTKDQVCEVVKKILDTEKRKTPFTNNRPQKDWWYGFLRRHPELQMKKTADLEVARAIACKPERLKKWYDQYRDFCSANNIIDPGQVFNFDESGFPLQAGNTGKVVVERGTKVAYRVTADKKTQITAFACICADGTILDPGVIFPGIRAVYEYGLSLPGYFAFTEKGYMETDKFYSWFANVFVRKVERRPVVLLLDGHESHIDLHTMKLAKQEGIHLFALPSHTSHITQPLDVAFFHPLKLGWKKVCKDFMDTTLCSVNKATFGSLFMKAWNDSVKPETVVSGFRRSGIWPIDFAAIDLTKCGPSKVFGREKIEDKDVTLETVPLNVQQCNDSRSSRTVGSNDHTGTTESECGVDKYDDGLQALETTMSEDKLILYRKRFEEKYNLTDDTLYNAWKSLKEGASQKRDDTSISLPINSESVSSTFQQMLQYPGTPPKKKKGRKTANTAVPSHLTSEIAINLLQKRRDDRKAAEEKKAQRMREREEKRQRILEEKERKRVQKEERISKKLKEKQLGSKKVMKRTVVGKSGKIPRKRQKLDRLEFECEKCGGLYDYDSSNQETWICCGNDNDNDNNEDEKVKGCGLWFHLRCTDVNPFSTEEELNSLDWRCEVCFL